MGDFAIVAEGKTDQAVLRNILIGFFAGAGEEPLVNFEQPPLDATGQHGDPPGGWPLVMQYFQQGKFRQALQFNRYLIVHLDTDRSEDYGVPRQRDGKDLSPEELIEGVKERIR